MTQHLDLDALQEAAEAATPGPWHSVHHGVSCGNDVRESICRVSGTRGKYEYEKSNRDFIAAANPAAILALIERLRKAEAETVPVAAFDRLFALNESNAARILKLEGKAEAASRWVNLREKKPADFERVHIALDTGAVVIGCRGPAGWHWEETDDEKDAEAIATHWMPLPAAPTSADSEGNSNAGS